ncbi:MAG: DUF1934 domain-containing protein [Selenomonadaceae bacterium]|nr:DUF1934 domain-containing protein [Selenomonadaceae bacterium]
MDNVMISIRARQEAPDGHVEKLHHRLKGRYFFKGGKHYLRYEDKYLDGGKRVPTTIKVAEDELVILRHGTAKTEQRFVPLQETRSDYQTPYGSMELLMRTESLQAAFGEEGGHIRAAYHLSANGSPVGRYEIEIKVEAY